MHQKFLSDATHVSILAASENTQSTSKFGAKNSWIIIIHINTY